MKTKKLWFYLLMFCPLLVTVVALFFLPAQVPMHYGSDNQVDRWGSKYEELILPIIIIVFGYFMLVMARHASRQEQEGNSNNEKVTVLAGLGSLVMFNIMNLYFLAASFQQATDLSQVGIGFYRMMGVITGIIFLILGNQMPKAKPNTVLGLRTPWSMKNERVWKKCQRFGGITLMIAGLILAVGSLIFFREMEVLYWGGALLLVMVLADLIYSYLAAKAD